MTRRATARTSCVLWGRPYVPPSESPEAWMTASLVQTASLPNGKMGCVKSGDLRKRKPAPTRGRGGLVSRDGGEGVSGGGVPRMTPGDSTQSRGSPAIFLRSPARAR